MVLRACVGPPPPKLPTKTLDIECLIEKIDPDRLRAHVARLAGGDRHPVYSPERHTAAASYVRAAFEEAGLTVRIHTFPQGEYQGRNVIATQPSSQPGPPPLLVCAHYDTVRDSPGADDNASGVAALLECARVLSGAQLGRTIEFAALDMEERQPEAGALLGATALASEAKRVRRYDGVYNLEMVGYTSGPNTQSFPPGFRFLFRGVYKRVRARQFRGDALTVVALGRSRKLSRRFARAAARWVPELEVVLVETRRWLVIPDLLRSDHAPFWRAGIPAVMMTDTADFRNPNYHAPTDTPDTLDYDFLHKVTRALVATVAEHADEGG